MNAYLWIKSLHVVAVISWMAGLLYLPRLFVYHVENERSEDLRKLFPVMEYKLYRYIMNPAMIVAWASGLYLAIYNYFFYETWFLTKFALVIAMTATHFYLGALGRKFRANQNAHPSRYYRILNEAPTLLMIAIVALVIVKPF